MITELSEDKNRF